MNKTKRLIGHVDMDAFFVAVERLSKPQLRSRPVAVGGRGGRGVVASASYEARKFGVRSAMPVAQAQRLCPQLVLVEPNFSEYTRLSKIIFSEMSLIAPVTEQVSIDEAYLDFTGCEKLYPDLSQLAHHVKRRIFELTHLTCSVGLAPNKLIAKIASDFAKPDGVLVVSSEEVNPFIASLPVSRIPGVGSKTQEILSKMNIKTCADAQGVPTVRLQQSLGSYAFEFQRLCRGEDTRQVVDEREQKSMSAERTFAVDEGNNELLNEILREMAEELATDLRVSKVKAKKIQIKIRYPDFSTVTRAHSLEEPTHFADEIAHEAQKLLRTHRLPQIKLRLIGLSVRNLTSAEQLNLFAQEDEKREALAKAKDQLKLKFGKQILSSSAQLRKGPTKKTYEKD